MIQEQELSERKLKILQAIIKNYLESTAFNHAA